MRVNHLKVEGHPSLERDVSSNAIINNNTRDFEAFKRKKETQLRQQSQIQDQVDQIESLKNELSEIKDILKALLKVDK